MLHVMACSPEIHAAANATFRMGMGGFQSVVYNLFSIPDSVQHGGL